MTQDDELDILPTEAIAARVRKLREQQGMSAQRLGERLQEVGLPWNRSVVANLESGRRPNVSVEEWLALAYVLQVAPLNLLLPIDDEMTPYFCAPTYAVSVHRVREWIRGEAPLEGQDPRIYFSEVPLKEWHVTRPAGSEADDGDR